MSKKRGFTLVELVIVISLLVLIISLSLNMLNFGIKVHEKSIDVADIQASLRLTAEHVNQVTRYTSAAFTVPKSSFQDLGYRDPGWTYIGVTSSGDLVIDEPPLNEGDPRTVKVLAQAQADVDYEIEFVESFDSDGNVHPNIIGFVIKGFKGGELVAEMESSTSVRNALQIEHRGSNLDPSVALAFSMHDRGSPEFVQVSPDAYITMVLDISGSMDSDMTSSGVTQSRLDFLKNSANGMIDKLSALGFDVYVSLVPFGTNANNPLVFYNLNDETDLITIRKKIGELETGYGGRGTATNTGDGIRRAYHKINKIMEDNSNFDEYTRHMMVLVDGDTNTETMEVTETYWWGGARNWGYYIKEGNSGNSSWPYSIGDVSIRSTSDNDYIKHLAQIITDDKHEGKQKINTFVIGFSDKSNDLINLGLIGDSLNAKEFEDGNRYIIAASGDELDFAFGNFVEEVSSSIWSISGPKLHE